MNIKNIVILIKFLSKNNRKQSISNSKVIEILITLIVASATTFLLLLIEFNLYKVLNIYNLGEIIINGSIFLVLFLIIITTVPVVFKEFNSSNYFDGLIVLPIRESELLFAKFMFILKTPLLISIALFFTTSITYGHFNNKDTSYYFLALISTLSIAIVFTVIIVASMIIFMKSINKSYILKFKCFLNIVPLLISMLILLSVKFINLEEFVYIIKYNKFYNLLENITGVNSIVEGLIDSKYNYESVFTILTTVSLYISLIYLCSKYYRLVISKSSEVLNRRRNTKIYRKKALISLVIKDFKILIRHPFYLVNIFLRTFIIPLTLYFLYLSNIDLNKYIYSEIQVVIFTIIFIESRINLVSVTSLSRDKNDISIIGVLPIKKSTLILSKIILGFVVNLTLVIITIVMFSLTFDIASIEVIKVMSSAFILCIYGSSKAVLLNLENPYIYYDNEDNILNSNPNIIRLIIGGFLESIIALFIILEINPFFMTILFGVIGSAYTFYRINRLKEDLI